MYYFFHRGSKPKELINVSYKCLVVQYINYIANFHDY